jgi:F0F1-type ATP synthase membrane subunit b/b'
VPPLRPSAHRRAYIGLVTPTGPSIGDNSAVADDELREAVEEAEQQLEQAERRLEDLNSEIEHAREHAEERGD